MRQPCAAHMHGRRPNGPRIAARAGGVGLDRPYTTHVSGRAAGITPSAAQPLSSRVGGRGAGHIVPGASASVYRSVVPGAAIEPRLIFAFLWTAFLWATF